ncbi:GFA family protein [Arenicella sp. 4NH20-0111]|uniref:GFA family protein n=1 Tax=Arenicella sp. 4NH20-0111 TaxID=3127648 RepID=UPI00310B42D3
MSDTLKGSCLCGDVNYSLKDDFKAFYQCHCKQCQQLTGSAFASNLFTDTDNIDWVSGADRVKVYEHPSREFSNAFCLGCGSALPFLNKSKSALIVPAGSLIDAPAIVPQANIFVSEEACWLRSGLNATPYDGFPE